LHKQAKAPQSSLRHLYHSLTLIYCLDVSQGQYADSCYAYSSNCKAKI